MKSAPLFNAALAAAITLTASAGVARSAISYSIPLSTYTENFDSLPNTPANTNIQTAAYVDGWRDDTTTVAGTHVSLPGWYLYHPVIPPTGTENGFNDHQRMRFGDGTTNTGSFWGFGSPAATDRALGDVGSTTISTNGADLYIALRLVNDTGLTLTSFTVTYDGEQWRRGNTALESLQFEYSATATTADWNSTAAYTPVAALNFSPPVTAGNDVGVDGNIAGLRANITSTVTGITWAPNTELWLRWSDEQVAGNDDGLGIDNVRFSAFDPIPEPSGIALLGLSAAGLLTIRRRQR